jgi:hypothetical protein
MSWYYADWSWVHDLITTAMVVTTCAVMVCAIVHLVRTRRDDHHDEAFVTNGFAQRSPGEARLVLGDAPQRHNGSRAA